MIPSTILSLVLVGSASAIPNHFLARRQAPLYPPTQQSKGFYLVANVTDPSQDSTQSINGWRVNSYHSGAGTAFGVLTDPTSGPGRLFYENGTAYEVRYGQSDILTDGGTPTSPYGLDVQNETEFSVLPGSNGEHDTYINVGYGTKSVVLTSFPNPTTQLAARYASGFAACNRTLLYGSGFQLQPTYASYTLPNGTYFYNPNVPAGCVPITLLPQCIPLNNLTADSYSSHEYANTVRCYEDVASIDWTVYSAS